ncbi:hypothetical protein C2869_06500 [Saccharobesus litoralis]|uniref:Uncharacterized protein n=2 Tax=Saccharobesus litoralis TaxID=2172099 RepID=A0A2S0VPG4_9ALTE|nr:hypothetical protein C2869_06500 [Saccharobesus litoralis]
MSERVEASKTVVVRKWQKIDIPRPKHLMQGYRGRDAYQVTDQGIAWTFPVYVKGDANAQATGGERKLVYSFKEQVWSEVH